MKTDQIKAQIEPIYIELFGPAGYEGLAVQAIPDHADEPALYVSAKIHGDVDESLASRIRELRDRVFDILRVNEEGRYPYIRIAYDDQDDQYDGSWPAARKRRRS